MIELSVIIPTRNRCSYLDKVLRSIVTQTYDKTLFEVIIIDNGSTDATKDVVHSYKDKILHLIYYYDERPGLHVGRHDGYMLSKSNILVYADDDIEAFPSWLEAIRNSFKDKDVVLVGGKDLPKYETKPPFWVQQKWYQLSPEGHCLPDLSLIDLGDKEKEISPFYVYGCNFAIRKTIVKDAGGFHPDGVPFEMIQYRGDGETHICRYIEKNHLKVLYNPLVSVYHNVPKDRMTIDYFCQRAFRAGVERSYVDLRESKEVVVEKKHRSWKYRFWRIINLILGKTQINLLHTIQKDINKTDFDKQIEQAEIAGYNYHQVMYKTSDEIREWVHRSNYWDI